MTTTVRVTQEVKKVLEGLARESHETMQEVLAKAVETYRRQRLLQRANEAYAALSARPERWAEEEEERRAWEATLSDGLGDRP